MSTLEALELLLELAEQNAVSRDEAVDQPMFNEYVHQQDAMRLVAQLIEAME